MGDPTPYVAKFKMDVVQYSNLRCPTRDTLQIKKLLQIKSGCCKFEIVAANFQNELLQIKRILLQIKTSKVCAH